LKIEVIVSAQRIKKKNDEKINFRYLETGQSSHERTKSHIAHLPNLYHLYHLPPAIISESWRTNYKSWWSRGAHYRYYYDTAELPSFLIIE
jgi:hypothetical protein